MFTIYWALPDDVGPGAALELRELLDASERGRLERLRVAADRRAFTIAHVLSRIAARARPGGSPVLSITHIRSCVACAVGGGGALGVDVEDIGRIALDEPVLRASCTPAEREHIARAGSSGERDRRFAELWTRKEACFKAGTRAVFPAFNAFYALEDRIESAGLDVTTFALTPRHVLSIARSEAGPVECVQVGGEELRRALHTARAAR